MISQVKVKMHFLNGVHSTFHRILNYHILLISLMLNGLIDCTGQYAMEC